MSGHSKWSTIRHKKAAQDAKRANVFTKLGNMISVAAGEGGGDLETNFKLKMVVEKARAANMPKDNIERAIKRGTGELKDGNAIEEIIYEAYGPGQIAMLIKTATDNKNRTVSEVRHILTKSGGKMVAPGAVSFLFKKVGKITIKTSEESVDDLELQIIEFGVEDVERDDDEMLIAYTKPEELKRVEELLGDNDINVKEIELTFIPTQRANPSDEEKEKYEQLLEKLEENDDVVEIYDNL